MLKKGDRVQENNNIGTVTAIHTKGTVDVLFDGEEYAIRRQDYDVTHLKENPMPKEPKSDEDRMQKRFTIWRHLSDIFMIGLVPRERINKYLSDEVDRINDDFDYFGRNMPTYPMSEKEFKLFQKWYQKQVDRINDEIVKDIGWDFRENPMRRNKGHLKLVKPKKKASSKKVKKLSKRMRAKLPKSDFVFPSKRSFPIPDIGHGRLALQYAQWPNNKKNLSKIKKAVFKRYPSLISWWNKNHPKDRWTKSTSTRRKMVANPRGNRWKMKEGIEIKTGRRVWVVTGRVNKGPKVFYTKKNASAYLSRRKKEK